MYCTYFTLYSAPEYSLAPAKREISKIRESILFHVPISAINSRRGRSLGRDPRRAPANTAVIDSYVRRDAASLVPQSTYNQESEAGRDTPPGSNQEQASSEQVRPMSRHNCEALADTRESTCRKRTHLRSIDTACHDLNHAVSKYTRKLHQK